MEGFDFVNLILNQIVKDWQAQTTFKTLVGGGLILDLLFLIPKSHIVTRISDWNFSFYWIREEKRLHNFKFICIFWCNSIVLVFN